MEAWRRPAIVSINPSATTKMHLLKPREIVSGYFFKMNHVQDYGKVLYDYTLNKYFI